MDDLARNLAGFCGSKVTREQVSSFLLHRIILDQDAAIHWVGQCILTNIIVGVYSFSFFFEVLYILYDLFKNIHFIVI